MKWKLEDITEFVKARLSAKRFKHVQGVMEVAKILAMKHEVNEADAYEAALVHDIAKEQNTGQLKRILMVKEEYEYLAYSNKIWHAPVGAIVAFETLGIADPDILNAIKYHTTGRAEMSDLEKVIFVADYTEPGRTYVGCISVRELWDNLDEATYEILQQKVEKVKATGDTLHPDTLKAHVYYKKLASV